MAETPEDPGEESKLELPKLSFGFGRRKKDREPPPEDALSEEPLSDEALTEEPGPAQPAIDTGDAGSAAEEAPVVETADTPTKETAPPPPASEPGPASTPESGAEPAWEQAPAGATETAVLPGLQEPDEPGPEMAAAQTADGPTEAPDEEKPRRRFSLPSRDFKLPAVDSRIASAVAGLVVGLGIVVLTFGSARGCSAVKGTASCGGIGLILLVAILVAAVLLGASLLRAFGLGDPLSSSFLAVGLVAVVAMLFFLPSIDSPWMVLVIPLLTAVSYLFSWWITRTFVESADQS